MRALSSDCRKVNPALGNHDWRQRMSSIDNLVLSVLFDALDLVKNRTVQKSPLVGPLNIDEFSHVDEIIKEAAAIASKTSIKKEEPKEDLVIVQEEPKEGLATIEEEPKENLVPENPSTVAPKNEQTMPPIQERPITLLESVMHHITIPRVDSLDSHPSREHRAYPLVTMNLAEHGTDSGGNIFPITETEYLKHTPDNEGINRLYEVLWEKFLREFNQLNCGNSEDSKTAYSESLLYLMRKHMWCVPGEGDAARISLYDHAKATAAVAVSLSLFREGRKKKGPEFLVLQGELEGTGAFVFNPGINGSNLKIGFRLRLCGRSFYLGLLVKTLSDYLLEQLGLHSVNLLWSMGGRFTILAPNTQKVVKALNEAMSFIDSSLLHRHKGNLKSVISSLPVSMDDLSDFGTLSVKLESERQRLLARITPALFEAENEANVEPDSTLPEFLESAWESKASDIVCSETTHDLSGEDKLLSDAYLEKLAAVASSATGGGAIYSPESIFYDATGRALANCQSIQLFRANKQPLNVQYTRAVPAKIDDAIKLRESTDNLLIEFPEFKRAWLMSNRTDVCDDADLYLRIADGRNPNLEFLPQSPDLQPATSELTQMTQAENLRLPTFGFEFISTTAFSNTGKGTLSSSVNITAGSPLQAVQSGTQRAQSNLIGVLHVDMDDFDYVHSLGLAHEERSLAKTANLFNMFEWFFAGYLNALMSKNDIYIISPGGDDLFLIGDTQSTLNAGETISHHFYDFCGMNPDTHISGAYKSYPSNYSASRTYDELTSLIQRAKTERNRKIQGDSNKNALVFSGFKISWRKWREIRSVAEKITQAQSDKKISNGFISNLNTLYKCYLENQPGRLDDDTQEDTRWSAAFRYMLIRNINDDRLRSDLIRSIERNRSYLLILADYLKQS